MDTLNSVYQKDPTKAPKIVFVMNGTFRALFRNVVIQYPMKMIGAGQNKTILSGYELRVEGTKEEEKGRVVLKDMTVTGSSRGLWGKNGLFFLCDGMTFTKCDKEGVWASSYTKVCTKGRLINCVITQCGKSGIFCSGNALIEVEGSQTKIDGNGTNGHRFHYGLTTWDSSSRIHLLYPLTKESVSTNNYNGQNYRINPTIKTVAMFER
jgi:hypothetical protein